VLAEEVRRQKDPYALYEVGLGRALLTGEPASELQQLRGVETSVSKSVNGMSEADRNGLLAAVLVNRHVLQRSTDIPMLRRKR